jgi:hypothetical protein
MIIPRAINPKFLAAAAALVGAASTAFANQTVFLEVGPQYGESNPYQYGNGGEFTALTTGIPSYVPLNNSLPAGSDVPAGYNLNATFNVGGVTGFETFCIEDEVDFYVGTTYGYGLGTTIQQGDAGIQTLTAGVAWLYEQFSLGTLAGYSYTNPTQRLADAGVLQATLWALQDEPGDGSVPYDPNPATNFALTDLNAQFGNFANAQVAYNANPNVSYGVSILELYTLGNADAVAQDQLVYWGPPGVPDSGTTALLVGASLLALAAFARRMKPAAVR